LRRETPRINRSRDTLARGGAKTVPEWKHWIEFLGGGNLQGGLTPRRPVMKKYVIAGLLVAGFATPAFAAEFFVPQNNTTHKCSIVSKKPDGKRLTQLGTESFKTKSAAETALKGMSECKA
jgi:hypothetical protein